MDEYTSRDTQAFVDGLVHQVQHMLGSVEQAQAELRDMRVTVSSPDRLVTVEVGASGKVVDLTLDPRIYRTSDSAALAATIKALIEQAQDQAEQKEAAIRRKVLPEAEQTGSAVGFDLHEVLDPFQEAMAKGDDDNG